MNLENDPYPDQDYGAIRILAAADDTVLAVLEPAVEGDSTAWESYSKDLPPAAFSQPIKFEFRFNTDDWDTAGPYAGWYLDDLVVMAAGSYPDCRTSRADRLLRRP